MDETVERMSFEIGINGLEWREELNEAAAAGKQFSRAMTSAFEGVALRGKSLDNVFRSLALSVSRMALQAALKPLDQAFGDILQGLLSGTAFAQGGVMRGGTPVPFAHGGVIASPVAFPLRGGAMGIAGERGAEAIMPLARGPDGRLGVVARGGGGGVTVTFNVTTPDAESFRQSQTQIGAMLARAVAQGQRNL